MVYRINAGTNAIHYGVVDCVLFFQNLLADKKNWEVGPNISKKKTKKLPDVDTLYLKSQITALEHF